jgi:hypothetical protein
MNTSGSVHSKWVKGVFFAFRRRFLVSVDYKRVVVHSARKRRLRLKTMEKLLNSPAPSIYKVLYTKNYQKSIGVFRAALSSGMGGGKAKKMIDLQMLSNNLTNIHSTCILPIELGLEREN